MFCYIIRDKLNTTLLCLLYPQKQIVAFNALLFMLFYLIYFSCYNIVAKFYRLELYLSCLCLKSTFIAAVMFHKFDQVCGGSKSHKKLLFCYHLPTLGRAGVK